MVIGRNIIPWAIGSHGDIWCLVSKARKRLPRSQRSCFAHYQAISWSLCKSRLESREYEEKGTYEMRGENCKVYEKPECNREESYPIPKVVRKLFHWPIMRSYCISVKGLLKSCRIWNSLKEVACNVGGDSIEDKKSGHYVEAWSEIVSYQDKGLVRMDRQGKCSWRRERFPLEWLQPRN